MTTPPDGTAPTMQMYLAAPARARRTRSRRPVPGRQHRRRGQHRLPRVHPRPVQPTGRRRASATARSARVQSGAMGEALGRLVRQRLPRQRRPRGRQEGQGRPRHLSVRRRSAQSSAPRAWTARPSSPACRCPGWRDRSRRRLHLRRLRQGGRAARGARRRRDLGPDPLVAARQGRLPGVAEPGRPGRWSSRRTTRRSSTCATRCSSRTRRTTRAATTRRSGAPSPSRGMGFFAGSLGGDDDHPAADAKTPAERTSRPVSPDRHGAGQRHRKPGRRGPGHARLPGPWAWRTRPRSRPPTAPTPSARCRWATTRKLTVNGAGYVPVSRDVTVGDVRLALGLRGRARLGGRERRRRGRGLQRSGLHRHRLWSGAGARPLAGHGLGQHDRQHQGHADQRFVPKFLTVDMKRKINITSFAVDPSATCGDAGSSSTGAYQIETSPTTSPGRWRPRGTFTEVDRVASTS